MRDLNRRLPPVPVTTFAMVPRSDVPRSKFRTTAGYKTTFDAGALAPIFVEEVLPGDQFNGRATFFIRMATPLFPIMDNLYFETFFFFVPNRIVWTNWVKFMGEQDSPGDSIAYTVPQVTAAAVNGFTAQSVADYFGLPVQNSLVTGTLSVNALPFRAYNLIFNEWFRDENIVSPAPEFTSDASQSETNYAVRRRGKRPDYFTTALIYPQKGATTVSMPLSGTAVVKTNPTALFSGAQSAILFNRASTGGAPAANVMGFNGANAAGYNGTGAGALTDTVYPSNLYADLTTATGATINALRLAVTTQQFLEKDARGGTRYAELLRNHFGVTPQDARLQRPEYCGGGSSMFQTQAIPQTSATGITGGSSYIGSLGATTIGTGQHSFSYSASEHGFIIGIINVRADLTYMQGVHRMFTRSTRYDYYWPTFAFLGEQAVRYDEIYATGVGAADSAVFGYQERWAEYRYRPSRITGKFRSYPTAGTLDAWHLAQAFATPPALNTTFIEDYTDTQVRRAVAAGASANGQQFLLDSVWDVSATRAIPARSVPGLTRF